MTDRELVRIWHDGELRHCPPGLRLVEVVRKTASKVWLRPLFADRGTDVVSRATFSKIHVAEWPKTEEE